MTIEGFHGRGRAGDFPAVQAIRPSDVQEQQPRKEGKTMDEFRKYPENRLDIRVDENGNVSFEENREFARYYAPTRDELEEELETLKDRLADLQLDEPYDPGSILHDDWEDAVKELEEQIRDLEEKI